MPAHEVRFFFDYSSPYSYFGSELVEEVCNRHGAALAWEPMVLGGIFQGDNTTPGHAIPKRAGYLYQDLLNVSESTGIPYHPRTNFLFSPILSLRATVQVPQGAERAKAVHALFRGVWVEDADLSEPELVRDLLTKAGLDGAALVEGAQRQEVKDTLRTNTEEATSLGVFGAPTFFLDGKKMFWGHDRLKVLDFFLGKADK